MSMAANLEALLARGQDNALLRYGLGAEYLKAQRYADAAIQLRAAVTHDPNYSAAWKLLGQALAGAGDAIQARSAFDAGIRVAETKGDIQAAKEMKVFRKRLDAAG